MGFQLARHTERLLRTALRMNIFDNLPGAKSTRLGFRLFGELQLILAEETPLPAIRRMAHFDLLKFLHPNLKLEPALEESIESTQQALTWYRLLYQEERCRQWLVFLLALTSRLSMRQMPVFCRRLAIPERQTQQLLREKGYLSLLQKILKRPRSLKPSQVHRLLQPLGLETLLTLMGLTKTPEGKKAISHYITYQRQVKTLLQGRDLQKLGYAEGPLYRQILDRLLQARLDNEVDSREDEVTFVSTHFTLGQSEHGDRPNGRKK
jgi:tRNA nucleotidyltransferase (CCA-adding enzyme)